MNTFFDAIPFVGCCIGALFFGWLFFARISKPAEIKPTKKSVHFLRLRDSESKDSVLSSYYDNGWHVVAMAVDRDYTSYFTLEKES